MTLGSSPETLDGINLDWFVETSNALKSCLYKFKPARRTYIPKANGKLRPLGISSPREKILQQSLRIVMEAILEPKFLPSSHGFRPKRGCHSALRNIRKWQGVPWLLEGDIKAYFDSIDHKLLCRLLNKHFKDPQLDRLYWLMVKAGYVELCPKDKNPNRTLKISTIGVPQGGIISPLWSNLVLHEFDQYMLKRQDLLKEQMSNTKSTTSNLIYGRLNYRIRALEIIRKKLDPVNQYRSSGYRKELKRLLSARRKMKSYWPNPLYRKLEYVRYADDWLVGVWGPKSYVVSLREDIRTFLADLNLELSMEKTLITNTRLRRAKFLATYIMRSLSKLNKNVRDFKGHLKRISGGVVTMNAPIAKIIEKLREKKFLASYKVEGNIKKHHFKPSYIPSWINVPVKDLIILYRSILFGILNYWSFVDNRSNLLKVYWVLKRSLSLLIRVKEKLNFSEFLEKYGKNISLSIRRRDGKLVKLDFPPPILTHRPNYFLGMKFFDDPLSIKTWNISTISALKQPCANCGSKEQVEMHHVKHIKTINIKLDSFTKMMSRINRKQVPLCKACHIRVHAGTYHGMSLKHFIYIKWKGTPKWT